MLKVLSGNFFCVQHGNGRCDIYTLGQKAEVVKCCSTLNAKEAMAWVLRAEGGSKFIAERFA